MDWFLLWHQMTLEQQLNTFCDNLAKQGVARIIRLGFEWHGRQLLPKESAAIFINGVKQTNGIVKPIRFGMRKIYAKEFLVDDKKWTEAQFEDVDWERLHETLEKKPDMHKVWLSKQHSNFCGTRLQVAQYANISNADTRCPNCLTINKRAAHLCICPDE